MFGDDFYPTPGVIAAKMLQKVHREAVYFLEPSAGKGDLAKAILGFGRERGSRFGSGSRHRVDVIELHPDLLSVLHAHEDLTVVGHDWLSYDGVSYYDAIVMNPPFSKGVSHLLRAWEFLHNGEIVCLLNQETIDNPYTEERRRLSTIVSAHGSVERLGPCFRAAERSTDVPVVLIYLKKTTEDDHINLWNAADQEESVDENIGTPEAMPALRDTLGNMQHYYMQSLEETFKAFAHIRKASLFMGALGTTFRDDDHNKILGMAQTNITAARAEFARTLRRKAWMHVFEQMEFRKWLDTKQTDDLLRDLERDSTVPFTTKNIKGTLKNIFLQRKRLFEQSVWNVFLALTRHYKANTTGDIGSGDGMSGWKSNDSYKVNVKLVFPYGCRFWIGRFDLWSTRDSGEIYSDLDRVLAVLDGRKFDDILTVESALYHAFQKNVSRPGTCESTYFKIRYYKKGTVHLKWKRPDLLASFNITAAAGRQWIGTTGHPEQTSPSSTDQDGSGTPCWQLPARHAHVSI